MALNGSFYGSTSNSYIKPKISWEAVQSTEGNYSEVTAVLSYSRTNTGYTTSGHWQGSLTVGSQTVSDVRYLEITYNSDTQAIRCTARVYHDDFGNGEVTISASGFISGTSLSGTSISQTVTLEPIARASTIGAAAAYIGETAMLAVNRKHPEFTHSIAWQFGALTGFIGTDWQSSDREVKLTATSLSFPIPEEFYSQIPNAPSGQCILTCRTYHGDSYIGQHRTAFTVTAKEALCGPIASCRMEDVNGATLALTGDSSVLIRGFSTAGCTVTAQTRNGAVLQSIRMGSQEVEGNYTELSQVQSGEAAFTVTDSRGYTASAYATCTLIPYIRLTCNPTVQRLGPTSNSGRLTVTGSCYAGSFGAADNTLTLAYRIDGGRWEPLEVLAGEGHAYTVDTVIAGLDYTRTNTVEVQAVDALCQVQVSRPVPRGLPVFDWGEEDFCFHVPVSMEGSSVRKLADPQTATDAAHRGYVDAALAQLTLGVKSLYTGALAEGDTVHFDSICSLYVVVGRTRQSNAQITLTVPAPACDGRRYQLMADDQWVSFTILQDSLTVVDVTDGGAITGIYGIFAGKE